MNESELKTLLEVAEKAISDKSLTLIRYEHGGGRLMIDDGKERQLIADFYDEADREHYAAFDPITCVELVNGFISAKKEIERLREELQEAHIAAEKWYHER